MLQPSGPGRPEAERPGPPAAARGEHVRTLELLVPNPIHLYVDQIPCTVHDVNRLAALACLHSVELSVLHVEWEV